MRTLRHSLLTPLFALLLSATALVQPASADDATEASMALFRQTLELQPGGKHSQLLRSLRRLKDPALAPLFERLAESSAAPIRLHGILGLAEIAKPPRLDLQRVAQIEDAQIQAELITAAMDSDLLPEADGAQMLAWPGLDSAVKVLLATRLVAAGRFTDKALLKEALDSGSAGRRGLAALLLMQMGDPDGVTALDRLDAEADPQRDVVRAMLLQTALRHNLTKTSPWAYGIATEDGVDPKVGLLALRTAMRLGESRAVTLWQQRFQTATDPAEQMRLALAALRLAPYLKPDLFASVAAVNDPLLAAVGRAGAAIAAQDAALADAVVPLLLMHHPLVSEWALDYAREIARPEDAQLILLGVVKAYEEGPERTAPQRLEHAVDAAQLLFERYSVVAVQVFKPMIAAPETDAMLRKGLLLGAVRSATDASAVAEGLPPIHDPDVRSLLTLIRAQGTGQLTETELEDLRLLVRGGGKLQDSLRVQAAWAYVKRTGQAEAALAGALGG